MADGVLKQCDYDNKIKWYIYKKYMKNYADYKDKIKIYIKKNKVER